MMAWLKSPYVIVIGTQALFTVGDLLARYNMRSQGFTWATFVTWWFLLYFIIRQVAMFAQLYVFAGVELGKSMAMFGAVSIALSNLLGFLLLGEILGVAAYVGVALAISAFLVLTLS